MFSITSSDHLIRFAAIESPVGFICPQLVKQHLSPALKLGHGKSKVYSYDIGKWTLELSIQNDNFVTSKRVIDRTSNRIGFFDASILNYIKPNPVSIFKSESFKLPNYLKPYKVNYQDGQKILFFKSNDEKLLFPEEVRIDLKTSQVSYISFSKNKKIVTDTHYLTRHFPALSSRFRFTVYDTEHFYIDEIFRGKIVELSAVFN